MSKSLNTNLNRAKILKPDEYYTQRIDIENELKHYSDHFKDKVVFCNCDDPRVSNFFHYFSHKFEALGLKKLITTCYKSHDMDLFSDKKSEEAIYLIYEGDKNKNRIPDASEIEVKPLKGDGDFRSDECIELLQEADVVVTNPPFSLFSEYISQLIEYDKKFIVMGDQNQITTRPIFQFVFEKKLWLGVDNGGTKWFQVPDHYHIETESRQKTENGVKYHSKGNIAWWTNLDVFKRHVDVTLYKKYHCNEQEYPFYDNTNVINVDKVKEIPVDYDGVMGVPITFLDKHNPDQFEIVGIANASRYLGDPKYKCHAMLNGQRKYNRLVIKPAK